MRRGEGGLLRRRARTLIGKYHQHVRDGPGHLIFVHVGKSGGASLGAVIRRSPEVRARFSSVQHVHILRPPVKRRARYLILLRNPVERALSAFNWRRRIVVEDGEQRDRFAGEAEALGRWDSLNALAEALYPDGPDGGPDPAALADLRAIHHLREDIAFYLADLLPHLTAAQIFGVMATESLDEDMRRLLGVTPPPRRHANRARTPSEALALSETGRANLRRVLEGDYAAIRALDALHPLSEEMRAALLR